MMFSAAREAILEEKYLDGRAQAAEALEMAREKLCAAARQEVDESVLQGIELAICIVDDVMDHF